MSTPLGSTRQLQAVLGTPRQPKRGLFTTQWTALHFGVQVASEAVVRMLLEHNADIEARDEDQWTALHFAAQSGNYAAVELLVSGKVSSVQILVLL
jgi:hypothetical protein